MNETLLSVLRAFGRFLTISALILQIIGAWGCHLLAKEPYGILTSFRRHQIIDPDARGCAVFGTQGIAWPEADSTYQFSKWMTYLATIFGMIAVFSDCTILKTCPCKWARARTARALTVASIQCSVFVMLALSFTVLESKFCEGEWTTTDGAAMTMSDGSAATGGYRCTLAWGGICLVVATVLWAVGSCATFIKAGKDWRAEKEKSEQYQADEEIRKASQEAALADESQNETDKNASQGDEVGKVM